MKFFDTEDEAWDFIKESDKQYVKENGVLVGFEVQYEIPRAVLHRKESDEEKKIGINWTMPNHTFISDESGYYDFFILSNDYGEAESWIVQDMDGNVRVWYNDIESETLFGKEKDIVYEKLENDEYIKVVV